MPKKASQKSAIFKIVSSGIAQTKNRGRHEDKQVLVRVILSNSNYSYHFVGFMPHLNLRRPRNNAICRKDYNRRQGYMQ